MDWLNGWLNDWRCRWLWQWTGRLRLLVSSWTWTHCTRLRPSETVLFATAFSALFCSMTRQTPVVYQGQNGKTWCLLWMTFWENRTKLHDSFSQWRTNGRIYGAMCRPSVVCLSVTKCTVAEQFVVGGWRWRWNHQRYRQRERRTDVIRRHDRSIAIQHGAVKSWVKPRSTNTTCT